MWYIIALLSHYSIIYSTAQSNGDIRLVNFQEESSHNGRLEIFLNAEWSTVCDDNFGINEANVVCHQLHFIGSTNFGTTGALGYPHGSNSQRIGLDNVQCADGAQHILTCSYTMKHNCNHFEDVAVVCNTTKIWAIGSYSGQIRLVGGNYPSEGRLEVYCSGQWGTVCDDFFVSKEKDTVCKQLGYTNSVDFQNYFIPYGNTSQPIWLDNVDCTTTQSCLSACQKCPEKENHDCSHFEDVMIRCTYNVSSKVISALISTCRYVPNGTLHIGVVIGIIVACLLILCCLILSLLVLLACCIIYRKQNEKPVENTTTTTSAKCVLSPPAVNPDQPIPPPRPCDLLTSSSTLSSDHFTYNCQPVDEQPVYILAGDDKVIYVQPPQATTPLDQQLSPPYFMSPTSL